MTHNLSLTVIPVNEAKVAFDGVYEFKEAEGAEQNDKPGTGSFRYQQHNQLKTPPFGTFPGAVYRKAHYRILEESSR